MTLSRSANLAVKDTCSERTRRRFRRDVRGVAQGEARREGQTIEGTIVAIGPEVAFVNVGGKGEATIDIAELKDDDGALEVAVGDRIQAMVVSTTGGLTLSPQAGARRRDRAAARRRVPEPACRWKARSSGR